MTRDEITKLLETLCTCYPYYKVTDPKKTTDLWEMTLGSFTAESVYKAARLHMETSKFFPSPAEIRDKMVKASIAYEPPKVTAIPAPAPVKEAELNEWIDAVCEWIGFGCEENDKALDEYYDRHPEMLAKMTSILPYER